MCLQRGLLVGGLRDVDVTPFHHDTGFCRIFKQNGFAGADSPARPSGIAQRGTCSVAFLKRSSAKNGSSEWAKRCALWPPYVAVVLLDWCPWPDSNQLVPLAGLEPARVLAHLILSQVL